MSNKIIIIKKKWDKQSMAELYSERKGKTQSLTLALY